MPGSERVTLSYTCDQCKTNTPYGPGRLPAECPGCGRPVSPPVSSDPDRACPHEDFQVIAAVQRIADGDGGAIIAFTLEVTVTCLGCEEKFRFIGAPAGVLPDRPTVSPDETEIRCPMRPASADPDFGLGIPGFAIRYTERSTLDDGAPPDLGDLPRG